MCNCGGNYILAAVHRNLASSVSFCVRKVDFPALVRENFKCAEIQLSARKRTPMRLTFGIFFPQRRKRMHLRTLCGTQPKQYPLNSKLPSFPPHRLFGTSFGEPWSLRVASSRLALALKYAFPHLTRNIYSRIELNMIISGTL